MASPGRAPSAAASRTARHRARLASPSSSPVSPWPASAARLWATVGGLLGLATLGFLIAGLPWLRGRLRRHANDPLTREGEA